jgi:DNA segregation ATPase FtsK/SpoIIIE-like protein
MIPVIIIVAPKYLLLLIIAWVVFRLFGIDANVIVYVNRDNQRKYEYVPKFYSSVPNGKDAKDASDVETDDDEMYTNAVAIVKESQYASISYIQRRLRIGYNRAVRIIERMKREWVIKRMGENKWELVDEVKL